jgi:hypothetical protein
VDKVTDVVSSRRYVYQVVIPEKLAESKWVEILKKGDPVVLKPWDPMGGKFSLSLLLNHMLLVLRLFFLLFRLFQFSFGLS